MDYLKQFLTDLTDNGEYYAEMLDNCAEIYVSTDQKPILMIEFDEKVYHLNFRCDTSPNVVAKIMYDMTCIDEDLVVGKDFFTSPETGIVYGIEAVKLYFAHMIHVIDSTRLQEEELLDDSVYIVKEPIIAFGSKIGQKDKLKEMWDKYGK